MLRSAIISSKPFTRTASVRSIVSTAPTGLSTNSLASLSRSSSSPPRDASDQVGDLMMKRWLQSGLRPGGLQGIDTDRVRSLFKTISLSEILNFF